MKKTAFKLVAMVVGFQMVLCAIAIIGCFITQANRCDGSKISELMSTMLASSFALYAAEK